MINILKQVGNYSLVENTSKGKSSLRFYVDNGEEVSEYFDILEAQELFDIRFNSLDYELVIRLYNANLI